jgi:hypothetical protein
MLCALLDIAIKDVKSQESVVYEASFRDKELQAVSRALSYLHEARSLISRYPEADNYRESYNLMLTARIAAPRTSMALDELSNMMRLFAV